MVRLIRLLAVLILPAVAILGSQAFSSQAFTAVTTIAVPGGVVSMDIFWADAALGRAYLADRTNAGIDVFDTRLNTFINKIPSGGGVGTASAPNGVATDAANQLVFVGLGTNGAGDGFLVANATTLAVIKTIVIPKPKGGAATGRADELAVAPGPRLVVVANDQDSPPFVSEISYTPAGIPTIVGQIELPTQAGCGIEQPVWVPETQQFMIALPTAGGGKICPGGIAVFNPTPFALARTMPTDCSPAGMAHGPDTLMFLGCTPAPEVVNFLTGAKVATLGSLPSSDEVWYDPGTNAYEFLVRATNTLNIYSAASNQLFESDPTGGAFHNLTADAATGKVFAALRPVNNTCPNGCIAVFQPPAGVTNAQGLGVTCGGIFYPSGTFCGGGTGAPSTGTGTIGTGTTTGTIGTIGGASSTPLGVTCNGIFYPSGTFCGKTGLR